MKGTCRTGQWGGQLSVGLQLYYAMLPRAEPASPVTSLEHGQGTGGRGRRLHDMTHKPVVGLVEAPQRLAAAIGEQPHAVVIVSIYGTQPKVSTSDIVTAALPCAQAIGIGRTLSGCHPHHAVVVNGKRHHMLPGRNIGRRGKDYRGEGACGEAEGIKATERAHNKAVANDEKRGHTLVLANGRIAEQPETNTIVAAQAIVGTHPDEATPVLYDMADGIGGQPVVDGDVTEQGAGSC